ncbi:MAG TPA: DUF2007 domain-containing protein [Alphaproteobacteria bacterium]|nr:DUF2007 domain-containing protein [Alphaproteobacteria bacterium]
MIFLYDRAMKELLRSNDLVLLSYAAALMRDAGIEAVQLDMHTSVLEGSIGALQRRLMVTDEDHARAKALLDEAMRAAGESPEISE